jgi:integrase
MNRPLFQSAFAEEMNSYLNYQMSAGRKECSFYSRLRIFDRFCVEHGVSEPSFSKETAAMWTRKRDGEATTTHYSRVNGIKLFLIYLSKKGYDVFIIRDVKFRDTGFQPHIYTDNEIKRYFREVDAYTCSRNRKTAIQYPLLFRLLYCCGARINETLGVRKRDIDIQSGVIKLDDGYIFTNSNGARLSGNTIYKIHRQFLQQAGIPFHGDGSGPRLHDWRHTMAVRSFKQMADAGMDMYVALPILSTYLGHKSIYATERYVRLTMSIYPHIEARFGAKAERIFGEVKHYEED